MNFTLYLSNVTADCDGSEIKEIHHFRLLEKDLVSIILQLHVHSYLLHYPYSMIDIKDLALKIVCCRWEEFCVLKLIVEWVCCQRDLVEGFSAQFKMEAAVYVWY